MLVASAENELLPGVQRNGPCEELQGLLPQRDAVSVDLFSRDKQFNWSSSSLSLVHSRGCLTQHVGSLDRPWTTYAQSLESLSHIVRSKDGYESVLRGLDGRLSEAVMHFMQHGPELEQKVGNPLIDCGD